MPDPSYRPEGTLVKKSSKEITRGKGQVRRDAERKNKKKRIRKDLPPVIEEGQEEIRRRRGSRRKPGERHTRLKPMKSVDREVKPQPELHARIKDKIKKSAEDRKQEIQPYPRPKGSEQQEERRQAQPQDARGPQKQGEAEEPQSLTRKNFKEMLKRKVDEQAAQAAKQRKTLEVKEAKQAGHPTKPDQKNSREGHLQDIRREGSECQEDQLQGLFF